jgi:hypothetical protein
VEIFVGEMVTEDLLHLWELLGSGHYQLSVPYVARNIRIESQREFAGGARPGRDYRLRKAGRALKVIETVQSSEQSSQ